MNSIPVFLASDDKYAPFVATTIASICSNTTSQVNFYVLDGGISFCNRLKIRRTRKFFKNFTIEFLSINANESFAGLPTLHYITMSTYSRLLIPILKPNLDKILYIDVDVVFTGDIRELYETSLEDFGLAAVNTYLVTDETRNDLSERVRRLDLKNVDSLFNAGILVMDCTKWRKNNITEEIMKLARDLNSENKLKFSDQDALNKYFDGNYLKLDMKWNVAYSCLSGRLEEDKFKILSQKQKIIHFAGVDKYKPWNNKNTYGADIFWKYVPLTYFEKDIGKIYRKFNSPNTKFVFGIRHRILRIIIKCLVDRKRYKKLKKDHTQFFQDSKNPLIQFLGRFYN